MIAYSTVGVGDMERARKFYDALFTELGATQLVEGRDGNFIGYGVDLGQPIFAIAAPYDGAAAAPGNGNMVAIAAKDPAQVKALYEKALSLGATDEGPAGPRNSGDMSCGYVRDLDGNKLNFFCIGS